MWEVLPGRCEAPGIGKNLPVVARFTMESTGRLPIYLLRSGGIVRRERATAQTAIEGVDIYWVRNTRCGRKAADVARSENSGLPRLAANRGFD